MQIHKDFYKLFRNKEYLELLGKGKRNLWVLLAIFTVTFTAIGFSNGSLNYLSRKMKSPFVNWVSIAVPFGLTERAVDFKNTLNQQELLNEYNIANVTSYNETPMNFWSPVQQGTMVAIGRSVEINDPVLDEVFSGKNLIIGRRFNNERDFGFIVTASLLADFGYETDARFVFWRFKDSDTTYRNIPLPVIAIVKELPGRYRFAVTPYLYNILWEHPSGNPFNPYGEKELLFFIAGDTEKAEAVRFEIESYFTMFKSEFSPFVMPAVISNTDTYAEGSVVKITFRPAPSGIEMLDAFEKALMEAENIQPYKSAIIRYHNYAGRLPQAARSDRFHHLSVNFSNLAKIRDFSAFLLVQNPDFKMDIAQVEAKENYDFISRLTRIISLILIIFSVYAVSMFLSNVLRMHIEKISVNLGTLMAFGIDNSELQKIYMSIAFRFVTYAMAISLLASAGLGYSGALRLLLQLTQTGLESGENYFQLMHWWSLATIVAIWTIGYVSVNQTTGSLLKNTPGNLVYERA